MERARTPPLLCSSPFSHLWSCFFTGFWFSIHPLTADLSKSFPLSPLQSFRTSSLPRSLRGHCCPGLHPRDSDLIGLGIRMFCFLDSPSDFLGAVKVESNSSRLFILGCGGLHPVASLNPPSGPEHTIHPFIVLPHLRSACALTLNPPHNG